MFTFHTDPGHGWLEVPLELLEELGIAENITGFSYVYGKSVFLEEDCDAGTFVKAYTDNRGALPAIQESYQEDTPVRHYPSYRHPHYVRKEAGAVLADNKP